MTATATIKPSPPTKQPLSTSTRRSGKALLLVIVIIAVLFPHPLRFKTWLSRLRDPAALLNLDDSALDPLVYRVHTHLLTQMHLPPADDPRHPLLAAVERVTYEALPYAHDWETWGVMDYIPTPAEALALGREDCDGRAVVGAALLSRFGCEAHLVSDLLHVWVETPLGPAFSPGQGPTSFYSDEDGVEARVNPGLLTNIARGFSFGVAVFPLLRELIVITACILLAWRRGREPADWIAGGTLLLLSLGLFRYFGVAYATANGPTMPILFAAACGVVGGFLLAFPATAADLRRRFAVTRPG